MKKHILIIFLLHVFFANSQIKGNFELLAGQELNLLGYNNFKTELISTTQIDSLGNFTLIYPNTYKGIAILKAKDHASLAFILTETCITIKGANLKEIDKLIFENSIENSTFIQYLNDYSQRQQASSAWFFLKNRYKSEAIFQNENAVLKNIKKEIIRLETEEAHYLKSLNSDLYVSWFLPLRKLVSDLPIILKQNSEKIPENIKQFRTTNFNDSKFKTSGLLKDVIDGHYMLLESLNKPSDSIQNEINISTQYLINNISTNDMLLNDVGNYLFNLFEKRSLQESSEYLAVQLMSQSSCTIDENLSRRLEFYNKIKVGSIAPDIIFTDNTKLSDSKSRILLVFGASWCPKCEEDLLALRFHYGSWKEKKMDIVYISIDTDKEAFQKAYQNILWKTDASFKGWETNAVKDYYVFATPTYFLLDANRKILLRPNSVEQVNQWIETEI